MDTREFVDKVREIVGYAEGVSALNQIYEDKELEDLHRMLQVEGESLEREYDRGFEDGLEEAVDRIRMG